jgi:DNA polymerase elongation subunit (family B)
MSSFYTSVHRMGGSILYRGYTDNGTRIHEKVKFSPTFFVNTTADRWKSGWTALDGTRVEPIKFGSINDAKEFIDTNGDVDNFKVYGNNNYVAQFINEKFPGDIKADLRHIAIGNIDIEVKSDDGFPYPEQAAYPVTSIAMKNSKSSIYHVWGLKHYDADKCKTVPEGCMVRYVKCDNEGELLMKFLTYWEEHYPDVITGWNVRLFDIPYLINRIKRILNEDWAKKLSPWGIVNYRQIGVKGKSLDAYEIYGVQQLDYMDLFQKFGYVYGPQESYSLNHICHVILGERKLSYEEYGSLHNLYEQDHQMFIDYNIRDVVLVDKLEEQTGLLALALIIAYKGGVNYPDTLGTTAIWDSIIYRYLSEKKIAIPPSTEKHRPEYPGGYVKDPQVGRHEWVVSFDLNSLYPMTIVQYNMSPETIVENASYGMPCDVDFYLKGVELPQEIRDMNVAVAANGAMFRKDKQGFLPEIIESYYAERKATKKKMLGVKQKYEETHADDLKREMNQLDNTQQAIKILMNSLYGALGNKYFRYFDIRIAEGITLSGQLSIRWAEKHMNFAMNKIMNTTAIDYVLYMDTDSLYLNMAPLVKQVKPADPVAFLDKACDQRFEKVLENAYGILFEQQNAFKNTMVMKREAIADAGIWTAKKRYILNVHNSEGVQYAEPKLKIMGIEAVKSSTPAIVRGKFKEAYQIMLSGTEGDLQKFVSDFYEVFKGLAPEDVSFPRGVSEIGKWRDGGALVKSGCPIHVRGAIVYNHHVQSLKLRDDEIKDGNKVKFCYLKTPNPIGSNVIAFPQFLPKELEAHRYIDYDTQFNKTFKEPLKLVSDAIKWELEYRNTLESFFA